jgi:MATE family multidrug resistance protein
VSIGNIFFQTLAMLFGGVMLGLDTLVSHAHGGGERDDCHRSLLQALYLIVPFVPLLMGTLWMAVPLFRLFHYEQGLLDEIGRFLHALVWSMPPLFVYLAFRRYLQATSRARPVMITLVTANLINLAGNWILIYGHLGAPALGTRGSAWSTVAARIYMAVMLAAIARYDDGPWRISLGVERARISRLLRLGLPAAGQITFEIAVFAAAGALIGKLGGVPLAAHQIAMNTVSFTYMAALGISSAAAVRVGQALGRGDARSAARSGWTAILLGGAFMFCCGVALLAFPRAIGRAFTTDRAVIEAAVPLLAAGAAFQLFDGVQVCATGALRGAGDTRTPMLCHLIAYWAVGLPAGYLLCFPLHRGAAGMWTGLSVALILIGVVLLGAWSRKVAGLPARVGIAAPGA